MGAVIYRIQRYALYVLGGIGALFAALTLGRNQGASAARKTDKLEDYENADEIEKRADLARADRGDAVERLRAGGRIRDE